VTGRGGKTVGRHRRGVDSVAVPVDAQPAGLAAPVETGRSRRTIATIVLAALWLPAGVAVWAEAPDPSSGVTLQSANSLQAVTAAKGAVHTILSYDYRSIGSDIASAKADTTGEFARQYASTAAQLLSEAKQVKAIVQATVGTSGVVSASRDDVVVLVFVDQASVRQVKGQKTPTTRIDQSRVQVTMTRVNGKWLISALAAL
jgi:Mce-associated membrane protein